MKKVGFQVMPLFNYLLTSHYLGVSSTHSAGEATEKYLDPIGRFEQYLNINVKDCIFMTMRAKRGNAQKRNITFEKTVNLPEKEKIIAGVDKNGHASKPRMVIRQFMLVTVTHIWKVRDCWGLKLFIENTGFEKKGRDLFNLHKWRKQQPDRLYRGTSSEGSKVVDWYE